MFGSLQEQIESTSEKTSGPGRLLRAAVILVVTAIVFVAVLAAIVLLEF